MAKGPVTTDQDLERLSALFKLLADKTRLNILLLLSEGERNVTSLCEALRLPQPTVSHHLGLLRLNNVITNRRDGKQVYYTLTGQLTLHAPQVVRITLGHLRVEIHTQE